jgi:hypothetical protein
MDALTTIPLRRGTRDRLRSFGRKGESWDALLIRLMDERERRIVEFEEVE